MDEFIAEILAALQEHGTRAVRVFPPESHVLLSFADRLANEVVSLSVLRRVVGADMNLMTGRRIHILTPHPRARNLE